MRQRECYHCKQLVDESDTTHDCWTTTEAALTADLSEDLRDAWERLRETAAEFGEQRIYASHNSIMFSRKTCYFFVRPKKSLLEVCVFLTRAVRAPQIRRVAPSSKTKFFHIIHVKHRDEVEAPLTDWLQEAYDLAAPPAAPKSLTKSDVKPGAKARPKPRGKKEEKRAKKSASPKPKAASGRKKR